MKTKAFAIRLFSKIVIFGVLMLLIEFVVQPLAPAINNEIAMSQMDNTNASLILMDSYKRFQPFVNFAKTLIIGWFAISVPYDTYKFIKGLESNERP